MPEIKDPKKTMEALKQDIADYVLKKYRDIKFIQFSDHIASRVIGGNPMLIEVCGAIEGCEEAIRLREENHN